MESALSNPVMEYELINDLLIDLSTSDWAGKKKIVYALEEAVFGRNNPALIFQYIGQFSELQASTHPDEKFLSLRTVEAACKYNIDKYLETFLNSCLFLLSDEQSIPLAKKVIASFTATIPPILQFFARSDSRTWHNLSNVYQLYKNVITKSVLYMYSGNESLFSTVLKLVQQLIVSYTPKSKTASDTFVFNINEFSIDHPLMQSNALISDRDEHLQYLLGMVKTVRINPKDVCSDLLSGKTMICLLSVLTTIAKSRPSLLTEIVESICFLRTISHSFSRYQFKRIKIQLRVFDHYSFIVSFYRTLSFPF